MRRNNLFKSTQTLDKVKEESEQLRYQSQVIREEYVTVKEVDEKAKELKTRL